MRWKVLCIVYQSGCVVGYDVLSERGEKCTVTIQQLVNAIQRGVVINARLVDSQVQFSEKLPKREIELIVNIQLTESEFNILYPYITDLHMQLSREKSDKHKKVLDVLSHFVVINTKLEEHNKLSERGS